MDFFHIITITFLIIICFIPIVFWGYFFSFIDDSQTNKIRFFIGIGAGMLSTFPILFLDRLFEIPSLKFVNIFTNIIQLSSLLSYVEMFFSLLCILIILVGAILISSLCFRRITGGLRGILRNFIVFVCSILCIVFSLFIINSISVLLSGLSFSIEIAPPMFGTAVYSSLKLLIFYYILVAFLEETAKHFSMLSSCIVDIKNRKKIVLFSIFIALGFAFLENILYTLHLYEEYGFTRELIVIIFYRSIFSLFIHVFSASVLAYFFSKAYEGFCGNHKRLQAIKIFIIGILTAILIHFTFDVLVSLHINAALFIYFFLGYFMISKIMLET